MIGALLLGIVAGFIGRALVPNDLFEGMQGPASWVVSVLLGLVGALVGYLFFTSLLGIGDDDAFDLGGILRRDHRRGRRPGRSIVCRSTPRWRRSRR